MVTAMIKVEGVGMSASRQTPLEIAPALAKPAG
jgi:hypothetical protein